MGGIGGIGDVQEQKWGFFFLLQNSIAYITHRAVLASGDCALSGRRQTVNPGVPSIASKNTVCTSCVRSSMHKSAGTFLGPQN